MKEYIEYLKDSFKKYLGSYIQGSIHRMKVFFVTFVCIFLISIFVGVIITMYGSYVVTHPKQTTLDPKKISLVTDIKNMTYMMGEETFTLVNGVAENTYTPGSATKNILRIFGEPVYGDLNADGNATDAAIMLQNDTGGSGTFYYAVLVINDNGTYIPTNAMFLGDRIAPQTVEIQEGRALYNFAVRRADEPMTTQPSIGKSVWIHYDAKTNEIGEWVRGFEGEAANNNIHVSNPIANTQITSPLVIKGEAKGSWFFEGSFPVFLMDWDGLIIAQGIAKAEGDWMTTNFVPFTATLNFIKPGYGPTGSLILKKDNPSGLPQNDDSLEIQVKFK